MPNDQNPDAAHLARSWDTYWRGSGDAAAFMAGGVNHPAIQAFWAEFFRLAKQALDSPGMIDLASGNGAVVETALRVFGDDPISITCIDVSEVAVSNIRDRFPGVRGLVGNVCSISADAGSFDIVTSQFGVEYAGMEAIKEASRLMAPGGILGLVMHNETGSIHRECLDALEAIRQVQASRFIPLAGEMFDAGFSAVRGADRALYDAAARELAPAVRDLEKIMVKFGENVAGNAVAGLYRDVGRIHGRMQNYDPDEVAGWLARMEGELSAYTGRMASMSGSALDADAFDSVCGWFKELGFKLLETGPLFPTGEKLPLAWIIIATK